MRILVYHYVLDYVFSFGNGKTIGGGEVLAHYLLNRFAADGHEVVLLTHRYNKALFPVPKVRVEVVPLPLSIAGVAKRFIAYSLASRHVMRLGSFDACLVVHPIVQFALALALRYPTVWYHIEPVVHVPGRVIKPEPNFLDAANGVTTRHYLGKYVGKMFGIAFAHLVREVLTLSGYMSQIVQGAYLGLRSIPVYAGIPVDKFSATSVEDSKVVTFVGRISNQKNVFRLLRAFKLCTDNVPEARLNVLARGSGPMENRFASQINALGLEQKVFWNRDTTVSLSNRNYYHDAQVVVYPTLHEAFGLVVVEAMASGRPVITSNFGGPAEIVSNNQEGLLVNPYSEVEMANAMTRLLTDVDLCREMGSRARARFERDFTIERVARSIESVLEATA